MQRTPTLDATLVRSQGFVIGYVRYTTDQAWVAVADNGKEMAGLDTMWEARRAVHHMMAPAMREGE